MKTPTAVKAYRRWIASEPITAFALAFNLGALSTFASDRTGWLPYVIGLYAVGVGFMMWRVWPHAKAFKAGLVAVMLASSVDAQITPDLPPPPQPAEANTGAVACGVVVVVIGGVAYYFLSKYCEKHFPKTPTNAPPEEGLRLGGERTDDYAASLSFSPCGSCLAASSNFGGSNLLFEIVGRVTQGDAGPSAEIVSTRLFGQEELVSALEYHAALASYGLSLSSFASEPIWSYGKNGQPSTAEEVPITIYPPSSIGTLPLVIVSRNVYDLYPVFLEKSTNLVDWAPLNKSFVPSGMKMVFSDISASERAFYRLKMPD